MFASGLLPSVIVAAAIGPALLLLWLVVAADSRPEPPRVVWVAVGLGALSAIPVALLERFLLAHLPVAANPWLAAYQFATLLAGIPEETVKVSLIALIALRARDFDEPMDGVVYGAAVGLGFAAVENLGYVAGAPNWVSVAIMRAIMSVPFHGALGAIAGAYIARARFGGALGANIGDRWRRPRLFLLAWLVPVILHSVFDGPTMLMHNTKPSILENPEAAAAFFAMIIAALAAGIGAIVFAVRWARRIARRQSVALETKRLPPTHWRSVWAESLVGVGLSFVALALGITGHSGANIVGWILMVVAAGVAWRCGRYLNSTAKRRLAAAPSS